MAINFFPSCTPGPPSNSAARWFTPCRRKVMVAFGVNFSAKHILDISIFGDTGRLQSDVSSGGTVTNTLCTTPTTYLSTPVGFCAMVIDVWGAYDAALWTSSVAITVNFGHDKVTGPTQTMSVYSYQDSSTFTLLGVSSPAKACYAAGTVCATSPLAASFTLTVNDDGTYTAT